jgi:sodium pump decarboxylase gamma subunit
VKSYLSSTLAQISAWSDSDIEMIIDSDDASSAAIASNWKSVKDELGAFEEVLSAELSADGTSITGHVKYEKASDSTDVVVTYSVNQSAGTINVEWDVDYPMGILMQRAALNTVMGIGIVFITLLFLSWLISKLHIIPDMIEKSAKKNAPAPVPAPVAAPVPVVQEEEDLTDDLELVAVITAAIAASETTSGDGFVVRSIKKANKRNWQRA